MTNVVSGTLGMNISILEELERETARQLSPVTIYMCFVMAIGILGNTLVTYVHAVKMKKSTANSFIIWLAVLDFLTCLVGLPMETYDLTHHYTFGLPVACKIFRFTVYLTTMTSVTTLLFIAGDRYCKICRPLKKSPIRRVRFVVGLSLLTGFTLSSPSLALFGAKRIPTQYPDLYGVDCSIDDAMAQTVFPQIYMGFLATAFFSSVTILIVLYTLIGFSLYKRSKIVIGETVPSSRSCRTKSSDGQIAESFEDLQIKTQQCSNLRAGRAGFIFLVITVVFIMGFLPSLGLMTLRIVKTDFVASMSDTSYVLYCFGLRTYFINNCVNFIIYGCLNPTFRKECFKIWQNLKTTVLWCGRTVDTGSIKTPGSGQLYTLTEDSSLQVA